jgi:hypothetical protein
MINVQEITTQLHKVSQAITGRINEDDLARKVVEVCKKVMRADACAVFLKHHSENQLIMRASQGYPKDLSKSTGAPYPLKPSTTKEKLGVTAGIYLTGKTFRVKKHADFYNNDFYGGGKYDKQLWGKDNKAKCESFCGVPLKIEDRAFGVLKVESIQKDYFTKDDERILEIIASMITSALLNLKVIDSLRTLFKSIGESPDKTAEHYKKLAETCANLVNAESCSIFVPNEKERLVMRGAFGYDKEFIDNEDDKNTYASGEGRTGEVFRTGKEDSVSSKGEVKKDPKRKDKLYWRQWKDGKRHICHSWYQFCLGQPPSAMGVMKVENKLSFDRKPIKGGGFSKTDKDILQILANSAIQVITKKKAFDELNKAGVPVSIDEIFSPSLLKGIKALKKPYYNAKLHNKVMEFISDVEAEKGKVGSEYLQITKKHINKIGETLGLDADFLKYCESLEFYEPILYQLPKYRSHFVHQLNVFLNGYLVLNHEAFDKSRINGMKKIIAKQFSVKPDIVDIFKIWFVTAIFHDTGYPLAKIGDWTQGFLSRIFRGEKGNFDKIKPEIVETISFRLFRQSFRKALSTLTDHLCAWLDIGIKKDINKENREKMTQAFHDSFFQKLSENLIAGILLIKASEDSSGSAKLDKVTLGTAVSAIVLDDEEMWKFLKEEIGRPNISFSEHPIAFLLCYCDNIQEHGRLQSGLYEQIEGAIEVEARPQFNRFKVIEEDFDFKEGNICCTLTYQEKPENWDSKIGGRKPIKPMVDKIKTHWKSPNDLVFKVIYQDRTGEFDNLLFNREHKPS